MNTPKWISIVWGAVILIFVTSLAINAYYFTRPKPFAPDPIVVTNNTLSPYPVNDPTSSNYALILELNKYRTEPFTITNAGTDLYKIGLVKRFGIIKIPAAVYWNIVTLGIETPAQVFGIYQRRISYDLPFYAGAIIGYEIATKDIRVGVAGSIVF